MKLIQTIKKALLRNWPLLLLFVLSLVTYGQLLKMNFWQDDNALVFKFTHINEDAGYLGKGIFGEGAYRYTVTPYYPIFKLFGYNPIPYFVFCLVIYILSVFAVYFFFTILFSNRLKALVAGLIYASGYIASDGFIRLFNSVLASLSVILVTLNLGFYFKYYKTKRIKWYFLSLLGYFLAIEFGYIRTHYLILVIVAFELIYLFAHNFSGIKYLIKSATLSLIRLVPFIFLFDKWYVGADSRSRQVILFIQSLTRGEFYVTYSFFGTLGNMLLSNELFPKIINIPSKILNYPLTEHRISFFFILICLVSFYLLWRKKVMVPWLAVVSSLLSVVLLLISQNIFSYPGLIGGLTEKISLYAGISFILIVLPMQISLSKKRNNFWLFFWMLVNLGAYATYIPIFAYTSDNRYLLHSLVPLAGLFSSSAFALYENMRKYKITRYVPFIFVASFIVINIYSSLSLQRTIIDHRSKPSKRFFKELLNYYQSIPKGAILYFYVPQDKSLAQTHYDAAFSVAQMPEETAIAWRYGIDRYDFKIVNNFVDLQQQLSENQTSIDKIFSFIANPEYLENTTNQTRKLLTQNIGYIEKVNLTSVPVVENLNDKTLIEIKPLEIHLNNISSLVPIKATFVLKASPLRIDKKFQFPLEIKNLSSAIIDDKLTDYYLNFKKWREYYFNYAVAMGTTEWRNLKAEYILDQNTSTYWEADRIAWDNHDQGFTIDLKKTIRIAGIVYRDGPQSLTPTKFDIFLSQDGIIFNKAQSVSVDVRKYLEYKTVLFDSHIARYIKVMFYQTLYDDAPGISEFEVIPHEFKDIDYSNAREFYRNPFSFINNFGQWWKLFNTFKDKGLITVSWEKDSSGKYTATNDSTFPVIFDGIEKNVSFVIPAGDHFLV